MTRHVSETSRQVAESDQHMRHVATLNGLCGYYRHSQHERVHPRNLHRGLFEKPIEPVAGELR